ncbi:MAG: TIGR02302 family protein [Gemmobacter sp.]
MTDSLNTATLSRLKLPLAATLAGLWAERLTRAFWPLWCILIAALSALAFGLHDMLPVEAVWIGMVSTLGGAGWALWSGLRAFRAPDRAEAVARIDATLPGQPLATLADTQAIGSADPASAAVWAVHRRRMADRAATARPVAPDLRLARRDPYGLRYMALTAFVMALLFGSLWRAASVTGLGPGTAEALAAGPTWEGWVQPPPYTGKPALYLNDIDRASFEAPVGSRVQVRLYGEVGQLVLAETVSGRAGTDVPPASDPAQDFLLQQSGQIEVQGPGGRVWRVIALPDTAPVIAPTGEATREGNGQMRLPFKAEDDHGVTAARAEITLNVPAIPRRFGLAVEPEPREALVLDLPLPIRGNRASFEEALLEDVSKHPFANLPVQVRLSATDAPGQIGLSEPIQMELPAKRFFDPLAAAIIEMRRDLLWTRENAPRSAQMLKAVTNRPDGFMRNERAWLQLRVVMRRLDLEKASLTPEARDEIAEALWEIALMVEEGDLASALERLRRAQDRLDEAMRNGADQSEIDRLMQEMREALDEYMRRLAEESQANPEDQMSGDQQGMEFSGNQLQEMLNELQRLMEEGRMAEAQELMEMMRQLMENMQVTQGQGGQGGQGNPAMRGLAETLRDQQGLSDEAFRELQEGFNGQQGRNQPGQQGEGQEGEGQGQEGDGQQGDGQHGQDQPGGGGGGLADRQRGLRDRLGQLGQGPLPGEGSEQGEAGRRALDEANRAMREAEEALRGGDLPGALDRQAEAMQAMRDGMRALGEAMAEEQRQQGNGQQGEAFGRADPRAPRDPLGREPGDGARIGSDRNMLQGEDVYRRAEELLGEIRRRQGEQARPEAERDYLRRLLDMF